MPLRKDEIEMSLNEDKVKFATKNLLTKRHACLTTYYGLDELSSYLASEASKTLNKQVSKEEYDLYIYDCALIESSVEVLQELGYSVREK